MERSVEEGTGMSDSVIKKLDDKVRLNLFSSDLWMSTNLLPVEDADGCSQAAWKEHAGAPRQARNDPGTQARESQNRKNRVQLLFRLLRTMRFTLLALPESLLLMFRFVFIICTTFSFIVPPFLWEE